MGTDREARMLAAGDVVEVEGKEYRLRPVVAQHLCDLERDALRHYKRQYLQTFADNQDLMGKRSQEKIDREMERVAKWDLIDLPQKEAFDTSQVPVTDEVKEWAAENHDKVPETEDGIRRLLTAALDMGRLKPEQVKEMSGRAPLKGRVRYDQWWVTASTNGMLSFVLSSIKHEHPKVTREDVAGWPFETLIEASQKVERLTSAKMGNT
jgi:hypothetical protein